MQKRLKNTAVD